MKFLVDNQLPAVLARWIASLGVGCVHVLDLGIAQASDREVWRHAASSGMALITEDEDFFHLAGL